MNILKEWECGGNWKIIKDPNDCCVLWIYKMHYLPNIVQFKMYMNTCEMSVALDMIKIFLFEATAFCNANAQINRNITLQVDSNKNCWMTSATKDCVNMMSIDVDELGMIYANLNEIIKEHAVHPC